MTDTRTTATQTKPKAKPTTKTKTRRKYGYGTVVTLAVLIQWSLAPIYWLVSTSLKSPSQTTSVAPTFNPSLDVSAYTTALSNPTLRLGLVNSLLTAIGCTILAVGCGVAAGYALAHLAVGRTDRYEFWFLSSRMGPPIATAALAVYQSVGYQNIDLGQLAATPVLVLIPTAIVVGFFQRKLVSGLTMGAVKG